MPLDLNFTMADSIITLDVGGKIFRTYIQTLTKYPESLLAVMFSHTDKGMAPMPKTKDGYYFLDVNPVYFELILDYLRNGEILTKNEEILQGVRSLANYFGLTDLLNELQENNLDDQMVTISFYATNEPEEIKTKIAVSRKVLTKFPSSLLGRYFLGDKKAESEMSGWVKNAKDQYSCTTQNDISGFIGMFHLLRGDQRIAEEYGRRCVENPESSVVRFTRFTSILDIYQLPYHIINNPSNPYSELNIPDAGSIRCMRKKYD